MDCLAYLHAKVSKTPEKYQPVQPIIEYPWDDLHYADELDAAAGLDSVQNLLDLDGYEFEQLLVKLCQEHDLGLVWRVATQGNARRCNLDRFWRNRSLKVGNTVLENVVGSFPQWRGLCCSGKAF